jgi:hypothetical protein
MNKSTPRRSIKEYKKDNIVGFPTKTSLRARGFIEVKFIITTKNKKVFQEFGYSRAAIVKGSEEDLIEDARLNAVSKVMYREGYFVGRENYEDLDQEQVTSVKMIDYQIYYIENKEFNSFSTYKRKDKTYVVERDSRGRFKTTSKKDDGKQTINEFNESN